MPLSAGKSKAAFSHNVEVEVNAGRPQVQAVAIAYAQKRKAKDRRRRGKDDPEVELEEAIAAGERESAHQRAALAELDIELDEADVVNEFPGAADSAPPTEPPRLAMDRAPSMRTKDVNGWLHVKDCNISKANVCPYLGREIPGSKDLGLVDDKIYHLYRDADALAAAAPTFERAPLMLEHLAVTATTAQDPSTKRKVIGAISNVRWVAPYLVADLTVWDGEGIEAIESTRQQELSPGYHYKPMMVPGEINGEKFDGRMMEIIANHLCIVDTGRTGPDVIVKDALPKI